MVNGAENKSELLILGAGTAGARVAYYLMQRGGLPMTRIMAVDTTHDDGELLPGLKCIVVPEPPPLPVGAAAEAACADLKSQMDELLANAKMLVVLAFTGGNTGIFYGQCALNAAKQNGVPATAIVALPHATDSDECRQRSKDVLEILHSQGFSCLALDCAACGEFFPDNRPEAAYLQAVRWVAETTLGYLKLFTEERQGSSGRSETGRALNFDELPRGIFSAIPPTIINGQNLDVPTFIRQQRG